MTLVKRAFMTQALVSPAPANKWTITGTGMLSSFVVVMDVSFVNVARHNADERGWKREGQSHPRVSASIRGSTGP